MRLNRPLIPVALTSVMLSACDMGGVAQRPLPVVEQTAVAEASFTDDVDTVSTLEASDLVQLAAQAQGRVIELKIAQGDQVNSGQLLMVLDQAQEQAKLALEARVEVPSTQADRIRVGLPVLLSLPGRKEVLARSTVMSVDPGINADTQALLVIAKFANADGKLRNGQRLRTRVQLESRLEPSVPFAAVTQTSGQSFVFRLGTLKELEAQPGKADLVRIKKGIDRGVIPPATLFALQTPVNLGPLQNNRYPVTKGLKLGQNVITSNLLSLRHGVPVKVKN